MKRRTFSEAELRDLVSIYSGRDIRSIGALAAYALACRKALRPFADAADDKPKGYLKLADYKINRDAPSSAAWIRARRLLAPAREGKDKNA